jgi:glycosyltransferase involved in cell wall biosynthesis
LTLARSAGGNIEHTNDRGASVRRAALLGNHTPRQCGIATFTGDLCDALVAECPEVDCFVLAMNDVGRRHAYPDRVRFELAESDLSSYRRAADFLNVSDVDVLCLQHEYGIFGGKAGSHVLALLRELRMPIVTTLHTILSEPNGDQRRVLDEIAGLSERIVVMSNHGAKLLTEVHGVAPTKVDMIPHGIPMVPRTHRSKDQLGVEGKKVILTFGLLSPDKGIEYVIEALPEILVHHPDVVYIVLGATHPHVKERHGEMYRLGLEQRAHRLGVGSSIIFHDRFVSLRELTEFLAAADIYITPYLNLEQITSGTLAYAIGSGRAVISTPYRYAEELLAGDSGILVPPKDASAIAREVVGLLGDEAKRIGYCERAAAHGQSMQWPAVAWRYRESFDRASVEHAARRRTAFRASTLDNRPIELPEIRLEHLRVMTDDTGLLQHATFGIPRYEDGYCLDDNARALVLTALVLDAGTNEPDVVRALSNRYLAFANHAFNVPVSRFRNFMSYSRRWTEEQGSEDSHGRALWALGTVVGRAVDPGKRSLAGQLFHAALGAVSDFTSPRAWAFTLLGIEEYLRAFQGDNGVQAVRKQLAERLFGLFQHTSGSDWSWFEDRVTYDNARLPQVLIVAGFRMDNQAMAAAGLRSLEWLAKVQRSQDGCFAPVGSDGFYQRGKSKAAFDHQPVEACAMVSASLDAWRLTSDPRWMEHARHAFGWFLGENHLQQPLHDPATGGCRDGLHADRANENQGAESTLSYLLALAEMRSVDRPPLAAASKSEAAA